MSAIKRKSKPFISSTTFQRIEKESARRIQQRERFHTLEKLVQKLFRKRTETMEISSAIISFLTLAANTRYTGFYEPVKNIPFEEAEEEVKEILKEEFLK